MADIIDLGERKIRRQIRQKKTDSEKYSEAIACQKHEEGEKIDLANIPVFDNSREITDHIMEGITAILDYHGIDNLHPNLTNVKNLLEEAVRDKLVEKNQVDISNLEIIWPDEIIVYEDGNVEHIWNEKNDPE